MKTELQSISKIFTERIFRIPDYQRGYAWTLKQLKEFWNDLTQLEETHNHYVGVLTLEDVPEKIYSAWSDDIWIIKSKSYIPYYIVDGQQRLTTSIILIQTIQESLNDGELLNYTSKDEIRSKFIFQTKDGGISRSYLFGYEKDNPSYEYLKTKIFNEHSDSSETPQETIYTSNLEIAKKFFSEKLKELGKEDLEFIYKKITQNFLFNIYAISEDVDTYVAFETMNNRGKALSHLELLKNRLIYLSTRFNDGDDEKSKLRAAINEAWKSVYHFLGKNKQNPLDDDLFLKNHFVIYFASEFNESESSYNATAFYRNGKHYNYQDYLLENYFSARSIVHPADEDSDEKRLGITDIYSYVSHLKKSVECWYYIWNPSESSFNEEIKIWLDKLNRIGMDLVAPLIMVLIQRERKDEKIIKFLSVVEKFLFYLSLINPRGWESYHSILFREEIKLLMENKLNSDGLIQKINDRFNEIKEEEHFISRIREEFKESGFYKWNKIRYFLYEYELELKNASKTFREKLSWKALTENIKDHYTVEHIFPQNSKKEHWACKYREFQTKERNALKQSLGNLLPLSKPKNCSLQDKAFIEKVGLPDSTVGFKYGSYSEIEVAQNDKWTAQEILDRGLKLLEFMERRWDFSLGVKKEKIYMLGLKTVAEKLNKNQKPPPNAAKSTNPR